MEASMPQAAPGRALNIAAWVASALGFLLYTVVASPPKLTNNPQAVEGFLKYGYTDGFRLFIGTCEFLGGMALLIPRLAFWAGCGLFIIMLGALYTHLSHGEADKIWGALIGLALTGLVAYARRGRALFLS
jgi:putative oxidoreductase